jgi:hypothetical protein
MLIREYMPADLDALRQMHAAQGFGYPLPNLDSPMFVSKLVLEEDGNDVAREDNDSAEGSPPCQSGREVASASSPRDVSRAETLRA